MAEAATKLDAYGLDAICDAIGSGLMLTDIAQQIGVSFGTLQTWAQASPERSARVREARSMSAVAWDEKAETLLIEATDRDSISRARELASHYRWRASKIAPKEYGDRIEVSGEVGLRALTDEQLDSQIAKLAIESGFLGSIAGTSLAHEAPEDTGLLPGDGTAPT